ncbi:S8 family serine peptidase [Nocardioides limicola]|uniref:S8 family serine peptidase n=1 Tax=Nocardioides limicola TaxID=2803368 RepID=UPI00193AFAC3|nr:S8 family serine peptidase [Nocardioides sp. DJM-14]
MRHTFSLTALVVLIAGLLAGPAGAASPPGDPEVVPGSWIVTLAPSEDPRRAAPELARRHGGQVGHVYSNVLNGFSFRGNARAAQALARNPRVQAVAADRPVHATAQTDPTGIRRIGTLAALAEGHDGAGVRVAILDTGIADHPDLRIDRAAGKSCISGETTQDGNSHGTHVAGSVAAVDNDLGVRGVASGATVVPVKVLSNSGSGSWASVICGVDHVTAQGFGVANMSLGGSGSAGPACGRPDTDPLRQAICDSVAAGSAYTVAAGNEGANAGSSVPAAFPEVITVSALADFDGASGGTGGCASFPGLGRMCDDTFAKFSNYGAAVDVIAPGVSINSTVLNNGYGTKSGTSMAAPHVAGVVALMIAADPTLTPAQIRSLLQVTGECPDTTVNSSGGTCAGQGAWSGDRDGIPEPLVNAARAAAAAAGNGGGGGGGGGTDPEPEPDPDPEPDPLNLGVTAYKVKGVKHADLTWSGAGTAQVQVLRDGAPIATVPNTGSYTHDSGGRGGGSHSYQICEVGSDPPVCSAVVTVSH